MNTKRLVPLFLAGSFFISFFAALTSHGQLPGDPLTNHDIVNMVKAKVPPQTIIEKIKTSRCRFDTNPTVISELEYRGVPLEVIQAMLDATYGAPKKSADVTLAKPSPLPHEQPNQSQIAKPRPTLSAQQSVNSETSNPPRAELGRSASGNGGQTSSLKEKKIRGYINEFTSPTSFKIEDYRITRDESVQIDIANQSSDTHFTLADLHVGTLLEIRGLFNEQTNELKATKLSIDLNQFRALRVTAILDRKPTHLEHTDTGNWQGLIFADGRRVQIARETEVLFKLNKGEKKAADNRTEDLKRLTKESGSTQQVERVNASDDDDDDDVAAEETPLDAGPLKSLADIGPGVVMTYEGKEEPDGTVLARKVTFVRNEMERDESRLWKQLKLKEESANFLTGEPVQIRIGGRKYKVLPNPEIQQYVNRLGQSLIPQYQKDLPENDPQKIPFKFVVAEGKDFNAFSYPNGVVIINSEVFHVLENEAQLAAIIAHEIAHVTQEHGYREIQHNKKRHTALVVGKIFAQAMGYYTISDILTLVEAAMVNGYSRTLENQADRVGMEYLVDAGYDPRQAPRVWTLSTMKYGDRRKDVFWSRHDSNAERRSFEMLILRNTYRDVDFSKLKTNEFQFKKTKRYFRPERQG